MPDAPRRLHSSQIPDIKTKRGRRITTARAFVAILFQLREEQKILTDEGGDARHGVGGEFGAMLDRAALFGSTDAVIGANGGELVHQRVSQGDGGAGVMQVRDDSRIWNASRVSGPSQGDGLLGQLERVWSSLTVRERTVLEAGQQMSWSDMSVELELSRSQLHDAIKSAHRRIEAHPIFERLRAGELLGG